MVCLPVRRSTYSVTISVSSARVSPVRSSDRMSTIIGFVGGGGIGYILKPRVDLGEWGEVGTLVLLIAGTVWLMDVISAKIRERIV